MLPSSQQRQFEVPRFRETIVSARLAMDQILKSSRAFAWKRAPFLQYFPQHPIGRPPLASPCAVNSARERGSVRLSETFQWPTKCSSTRPIRRRPGSWCSAATASRNSTSKSANRKQLRGNIYLAKVTRVEPSLQAAFIDYGGNRHGFLAFSEIHPDYYQIPVADRQALLAEEERDHRAADADADHRANRRGGRNRNHHRGAERPRDAVRSEPVSSEEQPHVEASPGEAALGGLPPEQMPETELPASTTVPVDLEAQAEAQDEAREAYESPVGDIEPAVAPAVEGAETTGVEASVYSAPMPETAEDHPERGEDHGETGDHLAIPAETEPSDEPGARGNHNNGEEHHEDEQVESVGGADAMEEVQERMPRFRRQYKIQEVIKRRQVMLVQVVKEERGTKGAALTTYLSLAGRYSVLMPNTARGGGISRKITSGEDRSRLKEIAQELEVPQGMGVILRTAGASRTKTEVKRDFEYLLRLWETVRDLTLKSMAPKLVYEEGSLTKRSIRDLYTKDIDEIIVSGEEGYKEAREFMRMLMPSHAKHVKLYKDNQPLFTRYGIESQLDAMFSPTVQLRSGGYIVINQAEALVAIDVNSGRATREHHIEDTALKTNCEAAEEIARQLRLRDLAGLIVIDFIDMDEGRNNRDGRAADEGRAQARPRPHPSRPHLAFRPAGNVASAHPHLGTGILDREMPGLRRLRPRALGIVGGAAIVARHRRDAEQGRHAQSDRAHASGGRALCAQP